MNRARSVIRYVILIVILLLATLGIRYYFSHRERVTYSSPDPAVVIGKAERMTLNEEAGFFGYISPERTAPIVPFVSGTILSFDHEVGDQLEEDDIVCSIDSRPYELQMLQAKAQYEALESSLTRVERLYESGAVSRQELDTLTAQKDAAGAQLELAELQLSYANVTTPISGTLIVKNGGVGSIGSTASPVAVVADLSSLIVDLNIPERYYFSLKEHIDDLEITVSSPDGSVKSGATVVSMGALVDPTSKNFTLRIRLYENSSLFIPGMYVSVNIVYEKHENVLSLPVGIRNYEGGVYYYDEGVARYLVPEVLYENDDYFALSDEYADYDFIVSGESRVFDGASVRVVGGDK